MPFGGAWLPFHTSPGSSQPHLGCSPYVLLTSHGRLNENLPHLLYYMEGFFFLSHTTLEKQDGATVPQSRANSNLPVPDVHTALTPAQPASLQTVRRRGDHATLFSLRAAFPGCDGRTWPATKESLTSTLTVVSFGKALLRRGPERCHLLLQPTGTAVVARLREQGSGSKDRTILTCSAGVLQNHPFPARHPDPIPLLRCVVRHIFCHSNFCTAVKRFGAGRHAKQSSYRQSRQTTRFRGSWHFQAQAEARHMCRGIAGEAAPEWHCALLPVPALPR